MLDKAINPIWVKIISDDDSLVPKYQTHGSVGCDLKSADNRRLLNQWYKKSVHPNPAQ